MSAILNRIQTKTGVTWTIFHLILAVIIFTLYAAIVVGPLNSPLVGFMDTENWEYTGYYLLHNIEWHPFPYLNIDNNQALYPYGSKLTFLPWCPERDYFYAIFQRLFGRGPWQHIYFLLSKLILGIGSFLLLRKEFNWKKSLFSSYILILFDFYTMHKWPGHVSQSIHHWVVLAIITDFLIVRRLHISGRLDPMLICQRFILTVSSFGLDLGYVAGYGLQSLTITIVWISGTCAVLIIRNRSKGRTNLFRKFLADFIRNKHRIIFILMLSLVPAFFYLPIVLQIALEALSLDWAGQSMQTWYSSPLRLLVPMFKSFHPFRSPLEDLLNDRPEGLGAGSPGWFLMVIAVIGLWQNRRNWIINFPFLVLFGLFLMHNPDNFPVLNMLPWFRYTRVASRFTSVYPVLLVVFSMGIQWRALWHKGIFRRLLTTVLMVIGLVELYSALTMHQKYDYKPDRNFYEYMSTLHDLKGEAVLDWPFCIWGADEDTALCPYLFRNMGVYALRRFHDKKVIGHFFGRLHSDSIKALNNAGWQNMFHPPPPGEGRIAMHEEVCFSKRQWEFFDTFFKKCDFAAINLYVDLLASGCRSEFVHRYGDPIASTYLPSFGTIELYPANAEYLQASDVEECRALKLRLQK